MHISKFVNFILLLDNSYIGYCKISAVFILVLNIFIIHIANLYNFFLFNFSLVKMLNSFATISIIRVFFITYKLL